jgi:hypothetical protein
MQFREFVQEISERGRELGVEDASLVDAWNEAYTSMNVIGAYHLYEDGYSIGDASQEEMQIDAQNRNIKIEDIENPVELLVALEAEFIELYEKNVNDEIEEVA